MSVLKLDLTMIGLLYIHIPFCEKKCGYCDFVSYQTGRNGWGIIDAVITEAEKLCGRRRTACSSA